MDTHIQHKQGSEAETDNRRGSVDRKHPSLSSSIFICAHRWSSQKKIPLTAERLYLIQDESKKKTKICTQKSLVQKHSTYSLFHLVHQVYTTLRFQCVYWHNISWTAGQIIMNLSRSTGNHWMFINNWPTLRPTQFKMATTIAQILSYLQCWGKNLYDTRWVSSPTHILSAT